MHERGIEIVEIPPQLVEPRLQRRHPLIGLEERIAERPEHRREGELDLSSYTATFEGGASGAVVEPGDSLNSSLYALVTHQTEPAMPPEAPKIPADMIEAIKRWIDGGALEHSGSRVRRPVP